MTNQAPALTQFRIEPRDGGIIHFVFDAPGRTMNVFSEAAITELGAFANWLADSDVTGVVIRSGKSTGFCAGADLGELAVAYDMIMGAPPRRRFLAAYDHFFRLSLAVRALETSGKPIASAISGLALGGGCELALGTHYRVLADDPGAALGLPESLVGLLPGAGGTQRLPRLIGVDAALPILLDGARLSGQAALEAGIVDALVAPGQEIAAAEAWVRSARAPRQPWDRPEPTLRRAAEVSAALPPTRARVLAQTLGHYPAQLAILDCVEFGLPQGFEGAIRGEMAIFAELIQRAEARNMIQTLFLGKTEYERLARKSQVPAFVAEAVARAKAVLAASGDTAEALASAGFKIPGKSVAPLREHAFPGYWIESAEAGSLGREALAVLRQIAEAVAPLAFGHTDLDLRAADYRILRETGYPAYLGGPFTFKAN